MNSLEVNNKPLAVPFPNGIDLQAMRSTLFPGLPPNAGDSANSAAGGASMGALLQALRRRWLLALSAGLGAAAISVAAVLLILPTLYTTTAVVQLVTQPRPSPIAPTNLDTQDATLVKALMAARAKSPEVLMAAVKDLEMVRNNPGIVKWLETAIKSDFLLGPEIMRLTLSGDNPQDVAVLLNRVVDAYIEDSRMTELTRWKRDIDMMEASRQKTENSLRQKKLMLATMEKNRDILPERFLADEFRRAQDHLFVTRTKLVQVYGEISRAEDELKNLLERQRMLPTTPVPESYIERELLKNKEYLEQVNYRDKLMLAPNGAEAARRIDQQLALMRKAYRPNVERIAREYLRDQFEGEVTAVRKRITTNKGDKALFEGELRTIQSDVERLDPRHRRLPPDIEALRDEIMRLEAALTKLGETIAVLSVEPSPAPRVKAWQRAEVPTGKDMSRQIKFGGAAGLGLLVLAVMGVGFMELRTGKISSSDEVSSGLGMAIVGTLPPVRQRKNNITDVSGDPLAQSRLAESVDAIRSYLMHAARTENIHVVMVTSAGVGEGKTSLASQLAASLARAWRKTLLVDGDMRHPATHNLFGLPLEPGFCEVLRGETDAADAIKPTSLSRLWLMPAGHCDTHALQALAQDNVKTLFDGLKQQYDFIIVDSCPVLPVADALSLGQHVDGVIFSVLRDVSRVPALKAAQMRLTNLNIRTLGAVLIGTTSETHDLGSRYAMLEGSMK